MKLSVQLFFLIFVRFRRYFAHAFQFILASGAKTSKNKFVKMETRLGFSYAFLQLKRVLYDYHSLMNKLRRTSSWQRKPALLLSPKYNTILFSERIIDMTNALIFGAPPVLLSNIRFNPLLSLPRLCRCVKTTGEHTVSV